MRGVSVAAAMVIVTLAYPGAAGPLPDRQQVLGTMKRATTFMVDKVSTNGGYVWNYLPDLSRRWGEMEARDTMIWIQPPGTATMGHLFLDAYHATGDEYYYRAAEKVTGALTWAQLPSGGWNYVADFGGDRSLRDWYNTVGRNGWRLEEFQHYWSNATFDDAGTAESSKLLLRMYLEKRDPTFKPALDRAIQFVIESQYPIGAWPQRFPLKSEFFHHGKPDYTSFLTFNDDVAAQNIDFLIMCYQALGDQRVLDPIIRGMNAFIVLQQRQPQPGWALQYTTDLKPSGARTYEPTALVTHTTATNIELLIKFYRLTGQTKFLARVPEAIDWLDGLTLPPGVASPGHSHPTFVEIGTNKPLYVHREGSNAFNGRYYVDYDPKNTIGHYSAFRQIDVAGLRRKYQDAKAMSPDELKKRSPLEPGAGLIPLARFFVADRGAAGGPGTATASDVVAALNAEGYWPAHLGYTSHPYTRDGSMTVTRGNFCQTQVGDETDTSPFKDDTLIGISTSQVRAQHGDAHPRAAGQPLMRADVARQILAFCALPSSALMLTGVSASDRLPPGRPGQNGQPSAVEWRLDDVRVIGGHAVAIAGSPRVVDTELGRAIEFNGTSDGLFLDVNPLAGLARFTVEVLFWPAADGGPEQRFVHFEEAKTGNRALIELRLLPGPSWHLDTYLRFGTAALTLADPGKTHPTARWHVAALVYDGKTMTHYVDGVPELSGDVSFASLGAGTSSIGVRQNRVSWFKGRIHTIRVTPAALDPSRFLRTPRSDSAIRAGRVIPIWPEGVPGAKPNAGERRVVDGRVYNVQVPTLTYVAPEAGQATGTAVIICPGGGYARLAIANEAGGVADRLHALGVATFVLEYRLAEYRSSGASAGHPAGDPVRSLEGRRIRHQAGSDRCDGRIGRGARGGRGRHALRFARGTHRRGARRDERQAGLRGAPLPGDHDARSVRAS